MSRSRRRPYRKDKGWRAEEYWRVIRREWKQDLKTNWSNPDFQLRKPQEIINNYDYCDWWYFVELDHENEPIRGWDEEYLAKMSRK